MKHIPILFWDFFLSVLIKEGDVTKSSGKPSKGRWEDQPK